MKNSIIVGLLAVLSVAAVGAVSGTPVFAEDDDYIVKVCKVKFKDKDHKKDYEKYDDDDWKKVILKCKKKD